MQPTFGLQREQTNTLFYKSYNKISGKFHFHSHLELFFVDEGEVDVFINDKTQRLQAGEMSVTLSYDAHAYHSVGDSNSSLLIIPPHLCEDFISHIKNKRIIDPFLTDKATVAEIRSNYENLKASDGNRLKTQGYIYVMLGILSQHITLTGDTPGINTDLSSKILLYINENYKNDITLSSIAATLGYNPSYVSRYFKECFNIGLNHYLKVIRLKNAVMLMQEKNNNITYCAMESGFNSMCTFYRAFYEEFGCSPKEFLKN